MLQNRVNELDSAILDIVGEKVHVTGFTREEMLQSFLDTGVEAWSSKGIYDYEDIAFHTIKTDALFIVKKGGEEIERHQYRKVHKASVKFKNKEGKAVTRTFIIRKSVYSSHYHLDYLVEKETELQNNQNDIKDMLFGTKKELDSYLKERFNVVYEY